MTEVFSLFDKFLDNPLKTLLFLVLLGVIPILDKIRSVVIEYLEFKSLILRNEYAKKLKEQKIEGFDNGKNSGTN